MHDQKYLFRETVLSQSALLLVSVYVCVVASGTLEDELDLGATSYVRTYPEMRSHSTIKPNHKLDPSEFFSNVDK